MTSLEDYAARRESDVLEFKAAQAVEDPLILPRAVCALLNSKGGEVIVGLSEVPGGYRPDPIPRVERARIQVRDRLLAMIDPEPRGLRVDVLESSGVPAGLHIKVEKSRDLHAVRRKEGALLFVRRVDDRVVPMSSLDVQRHAPSRGSEQEEDPRNSILQELEHWRGYCESQSKALAQVGGLYFVARMLPESEELPKGWREEIDSWYADPTLLGLRRVGSHFLWLGERLQRRQGRMGNLGTGGWEAGNELAEYTPRGGFQHATRLDGLRVPGTTGRPQESPHIHPIELIERVSAAARTFAGIWRDRQGPLSTRAWAVLLLVGTKGLNLFPGPHSPRRFEHGTNPKRKPWTSSELGPFVTSAEMDELRSTPDRLAHRLLTPLYVEYGLEQEHVPYFDIDRGRFVFD